MERAPEEGEPTPVPSMDPSETLHGSRLVRLFRRPYLGQTLTIASYGLGWGLVSWGFLTFVPAILQDRGVEVGRVRE